MVNVHCQLDWIWKYLGDIPLAVSLRVCPKRFNRGGKTFPECERHHPVLEWEVKKAKGKLNTSIHLILLPDWKRNVISCLTTLSPCFPHQNDCILKPYAKISFPSFKLPFLRYIAIVARNLLIQHPGLFHFHTYHPFLPNPRIHKTDPSIAWYSPKPASTPGLHCQPVNCSTGHQEETALPPGWASCLCYHRKWIMPFLARPLWAAVVWIN